MRELELQEFVDEIYTDSQNNKDTEYIFFLGAGCSKSSGIPLAGELAKEWYEKLQSQTTKFNKFNKKYKLSNSKKINYGNFYFEIFEALFPTPLTQQKEIQRITNDDKVNPSLGYYVLASLMQRRAFNTIVTTNFDNLIQDALIYRGEKRALVITHQDLAKFIKRDNTPLITKIHGDAHIHPFNSAGDTKEIPKELKGAIQSLFTNAKVICIGYRGDDESIKDLLEGCTRIDQVYWLSSTPPNQVKISKWWEELENKTYIKERDFDRIMRVIELKFNIKAPDFDKRAKTLKAKYDDAIKEEIKEIEEIEEKDKTYLDYFLLGYNYDDKKEYDKAIESYQKALKINPKKDEAYYNMGIAYYHLGEFTKVIECYRKALQINSQKSEAYSNLFELQLTQNKPFDKVLEDKYVELFQDKKERFIKYEMLKVLEAIYSNQKYNLSLDEWEKKYQGVDLGDWDWDEIDGWIETIKDIDKKAKLLEAVEVFKGDR